MSTTVSTHPTVSTHEGGLAGRRGRTPEFVSNFARGQNAPSPVDPLSRIRAANTHKNEVP